MTPSASTGKETADRERSTGPSRRLRSPSASVAAGVLRGRADGDVVRFRGIPYAAAPVGPLRFAAPAPHPGWDGVRDALDAGPTPLLPPSSETSSIPEPAVPGEEILNLDITAPREPGEPLPVYVWIHGGGYVSGSPGGGWFDGVTLARSGVVVVSITYRLGFEGFGHVPGAPDNRGVLDCLAALAWVRENIGAFGGDPRQVTVGGQSAGGGLVLSLLASPKARGLFRAAIVHSAPLPDITSDDAARVGRLMAAELGVEHEVEHWRDVPRTAIVEVERRLEQLSLWSSLSVLHRALARQAPLTRFGPVIGTEVVPDPLPALARPDDRPLLLGTTSAEFNQTTLELERPLGRVTPTPVLRGAGIPAVMARAYPRAYPGRSAAELLGQALTDRAFRIPAVQVAHARERAGTPASLWDFRWHPPEGIARHCIDLPFAWDVLDGDRVDRIAGTDPPTDLATEMSGDIAAFVRSAVAGWPAFTTDHPVAKVYDTPSWVGRDPYRYERLSLEVL